MARRSPQRVVTTLVGLAALAVLAAAVPNRERIAAAWHLHLLRRDPGHLERILERPDAIGMYIAPSTGTFGRAKRIEDRPPSWMPPRDLEALRHATALLIELDRDAISETTQ